MTAGPIHQDNTYDMNHRPVILCILDGWGHSPSGTANAIAQADTPTWDRLMASCPHSLLDASAGEVGLPDGQMGNSEVGHMNIGAGRVVRQDLPRIDRVIADGGLAAQPAIGDLIAALDGSGGALHLLGLMSPGGVHSHQDHLAAVARAVAAAGHRVWVHAFLDGRDTPPRSAVDYLARFEDALGDRPEVAVATVSGRYYAMDRDKRWDRVSTAYATLVDGDGARADSAIAAIKQSYADDVSDEFVVPCAVGDYVGMRDGDAVMMANFRADRAREIMTALVDPAFDGFARARRVDFAAKLGMTDYSTALSGHLATVFPPIDLTGTLGEAVSAAGLRQLRVAETEKYAHVTFFLNGGREIEFPGEERILVPSPKVATYDLKPEMSAPEVTDALCRAIDSDQFDLIVCNFANTDMVGHTGKLSAAIKAVETIDRCLGRITEALETRGGAMLITADHGNAEQMVDPESDQAHTAHTMNPVPLVLVGAPNTTVGAGRLADLAPTVLTLMGLDIPAEMTGRVLVVPDRVPDTVEARATA